MMIDAADVALDLLAQGEDQRVAVRILLTGIHKHDDFNRMVLYPGDVAGTASLIHKGIGTMTLDVMQLYTMLRLLDKGFSVDLVFGRLRDILENVDEIHDFPMPGRDG